MPLATASDDSSYTSSLLTYPTTSSSATSSSSSSLIKFQSMPDSGTDQSLKRKWSCSHHPQLSSDYPTPSPPESVEAITRTEEPIQQQERKLYQKQKQGLRSKQESHDWLSRILTLPHDAHTALPSQASSTLPVGTSLRKSEPEIETPGPASYESKEQGTQTELELPVTESYLHWSGRGRLPFKTPAIAAIDGLKSGAKFVHWLELETVKERKELEKLIQWKIYCLHGARRTRLEIVQDKMDPLKSMVVLGQPDVDQFHGKSKSPDKYIAKMRISIPPVHHEYLETYKCALPEQVDKLLELLEEELGEGCIPLTYEAEIKKLQPNGLRGVPRSAFSAMEARSEAGIEKLWDRACEIVNNSLECIETTADENAWGTGVVQKALEWETLGPERKCVRPTFSRAVNIQSQLLAKSCRQKYNGEPFETKKTDWALSFSSQHPEVRHQYEALASDGHPPALSQMNNMSTSHLILYSATEIKVTTGNKLQAQAQLFTWFQAGFSRLRKLLKRVGNGTPTADSALPLLGWTVIGERWELYMAIGDGNNEADPIIIIGPLRTCQCATSSYSGAFRLLQLVERVKDWGREVYWPWYCEAVVEPLKLVKGQRVTQEEEADEAVDVEEREALED